RDLEASLNNKRPHFALRTRLDPVSTAPGTDTLNHTADFCSKAVRGMIFVSLLAFAAAVSAHEVRPAYLQLHQTSAETYDVFWKVPGRGDNLRLSLYVELPKNCANASQPRGVL